MIVKLSNQKLTAEINSLGAELMSLRDDSTNYIWDIDEDFWNKTSPVLFPIVGRLKNDSYHISEKQFQLPRHGFARNYDFEIIEQKENVVVFCLKENDETLKSYPFSFELHIRYTLTEDTLQINYLVKNNSNASMPFSLGAHPAFKINNTLGNYSIEFDQDTQLETHELENEQFSGKTKKITLEKNRLPLSYPLFKKDALVFKKISSRNLTIFENEVPYLKIGLGNFPDLGIWTKNKAPFLCIEPWLGYADYSNSNGDFFAKKGIQILEPKQVFEAFFTIAIL